MAIRLITGVLRRFVHATGCGKHLFVIIITIIIIIIIIMIIIVIIIIIIIGETGRNLQVRLREHQRHTLNAQFDRSAVAEHAHVSGHHVNWDGASVLDYESN